MKNLYVLCIVIALFAVSAFSQLSRSRKFSWGTDTLLIDSIDARKISVEQIDSVYIRRVTSENNDTLITINNADGSDLIDLTSVCVRYPIILTEPAGGGGDLDTLYFDTTGVPNGWIVTVVNTINGTSSENVHFVKASESPLYDSQWYIPSSITTGFFTCYRLLKTSKGWVFFTDRN